MLSESYNRATLLRLLGQTTNSQKNYNKLMPYENAISIDILVHLETEYTRLMVAM